MHCRHSTEWEVSVIAKDTKASYFILLEADQSHDAGHVGYGKDGPILCNYSPRSLSASPSHDVGQKGETKLAALLSLLHNSIVHARVVYL